MIELALGHDKEGGDLDECDCYELVKDRNIVRILLPNEWPRDVTEEKLLVYLRYLGDENIYHIPLQIYFNDAAPTI